MTNNDILRYKAGLIKIAKRHGIKTSADIIGKNFANEMKINIYYLKEAFKRGLITKYDVVEAFTK